ncbi:MAG: heme-binding domain-containing protein [Chloroflexi bacterium]|nr:heme-binding domain-containing protein [Chloroflexota bacterium]
MPRGRKIVLGLAALLAAGFIVIQLLPVGNFVPVLKRDPNPAVIRLIAWDSPQTEQTARQACFDCHSNETVWPWYAQIAPASWLVTRDVNKGRAALNFSEDDPREIDVADLEWHIHNDMPPWFYLPLHPEANLNAEQKAQFIAGLRATFGSSSEAPEMEEMEMDDD